jgi:hypothetical protein
MSHHCCLHRHVSLVLMVPLLFEHGGQLVVSVVVQLVLGTANCSNKGRRARSLVATIWSQPREGWENEQDLGLRSRARSRDVQVQGEGDVSCYVTRHACCSVRRCFNLFCSLARGWSAGPSSCPAHAPPLIKMHQCNALPLFSY